LSCVGPFTRKLAFGVEQKLDELLVQLERKAEECKALAEKALAERDMERYDYYLTMYNHAVNLRDYLEGARKFVEGQG